MDMNLNLVWNGQRVALQSNPSAIFDPIESYASAPLAFALDQLQHLQVYECTTKKHGKKAMGFAAQDVELAFPNLITRHLTNRTIEERSNINNSVDEPEVSFHPSHTHTRALSLFLIYRKSGDRERSP